MSEKRLGVLLACFGKPDAAAKARRAVDAKVRSGGDVILDTVVLKVGEKHKAQIHDPRRVLMGTLVPALTWGLFGLIANGWIGLAIWAVLGALCGGVYSYYSVHLPTKAELAHVGARLPANSSALLTFVETSDPRRSLAAVSDHQPAVASIAAIDPHLGARVFAGADNPIELPASSNGGGLPPDRAAFVGMIMLRYSEVGKAKQVAARVKPGGKKKATEATEVELVVETDSDGHTHVHDPKLGVRATAKSDIVSWGLFGVLVGAISGASGGGILEGGVVTGVAWGVFGLFAGALYGLWAGRSISARRLRGLGPLLVPGTSILLAWADGPVEQETIDTLSAAQSERLVLRFNQVEQGAVLEAV